MTEKEIIKRKIFLKRQLIQITEKEIKILEDELNHRGIIGHEDNASGFELRRGK